MRITRALARAGHADQGQKLGEEILHAQELPHGKPRLQDVLEDRRQAVEACLIRRPKAEDRFRDAAEERIGEIVDQIRRSCSRQSVERRLNLPIDQRLPRRQPVSAQTLRHGATRQRMPLAGHEEHRVAGDPDRLGQILAARRRKLPEMRLHDRGRKIGVVVDDGAGRGGILHLDQPGIHPARPSFELAGNDNGILHHGRRVEADEILMQGKPGKPSRNGRNRGGEDQAAQGSRQDTCGPLCRS